MNKLVIGYALVLFLLLGCSKQEEPVPVVKKVQAPGVMQVIVPEDVKVGWTAVKITVADREVNSSAVYTVAIGSSFVIPGSKMKIGIETFLPNFIMSDGKITSRGTGVENPAVQVVISDNGEQLYDGWLFAQYSKAHNFSHPRYDLSLSGFVAAPKAAKVPAEKG
jgi:hypothetical protein